MNIVFYGERGLVNSIIADMGTDLEKHKKFIASIKLFDGGGIPWANDIIEIPEYIIEASFSEFGDPDLIVVAQANKKRYVIFIEAKRCSYDDASAELSTANPLQLVSYKDKASKINVQLALKYRFVQAYQDMIKNNKRSVTFEKDMENDEDNTWTKYNDGPRQLKKKEVVDLCKKHVGDADDFYFVALTNDSDNETESGEPYQDELFLPPLGECWGETKNKFGLLTYAALENVGVVSKDCGYYKSPRETCLGLPADTNTSSNDEKLHTINMSEWTPDQIDFLEQFKNRVENLTDAKVEICAGSYSVKVQDITLVKFFASTKKDDVYLIFRNENLPEDLFKKEEKVKNVLVGTANKAKPFAIIYEGNAEEIMSCLNATVDFINWWEKEDI